MEPEIIKEVRAFMAETGLSAHRVGIIAADNGRLIERLEKGGRVWPETSAKIRKRIADYRNRKSKAGPEN